VLRLKYERLQRRMSQSGVGAAARIHQPTVTLIENGRLIPTPAQLQRLANVFGLPPEALLKPIEIVESVVIVPDTTPRVESGPIAPGEEQTA
jgi:transcriptional regulator with XRE-family HTH domain